MRVSVCVYFCLLLFTELFPSRFCHLQFAYAILCWQLFLVLYSFCCVFSLIENLMLKKKLDYLTLYNKIMKVTIPQREQNGPFVIL